MTPGQGAISRGIAWYFFWRIHAGFLILGAVVAFALQPLGSVHEFYVLAVLLLQYTLLSVIVAIVCREALRTNFNGRRFAITRTSGKSDGAGAASVSIDSTTALTDPVLRAVSFQIWWRLVPAMLVVYELPNVLFGLPSVTDVGAVGISGDMFVHAGFSLAQLACLYFVMWIVLRWALRHRFGEFSIAFVDGSAPGSAAVPEISLKGGV